MRAAVTTISLVASAPRSSTPDAAWPQSTYVAATRLTWTKKLPVWLPSAIIRSIVLAGS
ncbi:MAG: hypothetical protein R3B06_11365 [Kofleriaceae bacterium]